MSLELAACILEVPFLFEQGLQRLRFPFASGLGFRVEGLGLGFRVIGFRV